MLALKIYYVMFLSIKVKEFESEFIELLKAKHSDVLATLKSGKLTDEVTDTLTKVAQDLSANYKLIKKHGQFKRNT